MATKDIEDFQKQTLDLLRAQQETYLKAVKAWRDTMSGAATAQPAAPKSQQFDGMPTAAEVAEAGYSFASKLLADQSRFLEELAKTMMTPPGPGKPKTGA